MLGESPDVSLMKLLGTAGPDRFQCERQSVRHGRAAGGHRIVFQFVRDLLFASLLVNPNNQSFEGRVFDHRVDPFKRRRLVLVHQVEADLQYCASLFVVEILVADLPPDHVQRGRVGEDDL